MPGGDELWSTGTSNHGDPTSTTWCPKCCDTTLQIGDTWFFEPDLPVRPLAELIRVYHQTVGRNGGESCSLVFPRSLSPIVSLNAFCSSRDGLCD